LIPVHLQVDSDSDTEEDQLASDGPTRPVTPDNPLSPSFEHFSSPLTPLPLSRYASPTVTETTENVPRQRLITYRRVDRERVHTERAAAAKKAKDDAAAARKQKKKDAAAAKKYLRKPTRQSGRIYRLNIDYRSPGTWTHRDLISMGKVVTEVDSE
jgi:hypothetical protein